MEMVRVSQTWCKGEEARSTCTHDVETLSRQGCKQVSYPADILAIACLESQGLESEQCRRLLCILSMYFRSRRLLVGYLLPQSKGSKKM